ncbi:MAG TPA: hypothetical protein VH373_21475 [Jatrophihabitantaceae bacterium]
MVVVVVAAVDDALVVGVGLGDVEWVAGLLDGALLDEGRGVGLCRWWRHHHDDADVL